MYATIKKLVDDYKSTGRTLPCSATNENGENVIISEGMNDGVHYFQLCTAQHNNFMRVNDYYEDGTSEEYFDN